MQIPFLTIVIPMYNAENTIKQALNSITAQAYNEIEIIVVNDGSTDCSLKICEELAINDPRIKLFTIKNSGVSYARNFGIDQASGKYITFLDSDDYYNDNFLSVVTSEIEENTQMLVYGYNIVKDGQFSSFKSPIRESVQLNTKDEFRKIAISLIGNEMINAPWNKIYLTSYIKLNNISFPTNIDIGEDLSFNLLVAKNISFVKLINQALINYRVKSGEGLVSKFRPNRLEIRMSLLEKIKETLLYWGLLDDNKPMLDRILIKDFMAGIMDLYKKSCQFTKQEKLAFIQNVLIKEEKYLKNCSTRDPLTYILKGIISTKNSIIILFFAKLLSIKRGFR
ncbi:glycosyltransferase family 2 protein [Gottfriedia acidiceleris]|uniref:glycosyltransferase family 2 protein n=1 Tax=Gottfriedia acidiceleris TaxID=371036 RepID=UPI002FFD95DD